MDVKQKPKPRPASRLDLADRQIGVLKRKLLPYDPHLLKVDIKNPFNGGYPHEFENTPFEMHEVKDLQYMTMISEGSRGIADAKGNWQDEINSRSPSVQAARSTAATPNASRESKAPVKKISIADYKNRKAGVKTTPNPGVADESRPGHSRNTSAVSISTPMSRVPSFEGPPEVKQNGASFNPVSTEKSTPRETHKSAAQTATVGDANSKFHPAINGHIQPSRNSLQAKTTNSNIQAQKNSLLQQPREQLRHGLPPRPQSPSRKHIDRREPTSEPRQLKRPFESLDTGSSEKRVKIDQTRTPSNSQPSLSRKQESHFEKKPRSPVKPQKSHASPQPKKTTSLKKPIETAKYEKPVHIPPLLSPLPADLENIPTPPVSKVKSSDSEKRAPSNTPSKSKIPLDTIVVKSRPVAPPASNSSPLSTPPNSNSSSTPPFVPPKLLSPTLPAIVEEELHRLHLKSAAAAQNTVEARHEKVRRPDAPGVARKTPKTGNRATKAPAATQTKDSLLVKLKYKKRKANDIARILKLEPRPTKEFLRLERERVARQDLPKEEDSDEGAPLPVMTSKPPAAPTFPKKRSGESFESRTSEPAAKRPKGPDNLDVSKARTPVEPTFKSAAVSAPPPSQKTLLATPKKGDAMKSVAMRKVDSSDGHARTPQTVSTSTPASAEKLRSNGDSRLSMESDGLRAVIKHFDDQALKLKRKMDEILQTKTRNFGNITEAQKILGLSVGLECIAMYMQSFSAKEKTAKHRQAVTWEGGIKLWEFVDNLARQFPVLNALSAQIGAVCKEELGRAYIEELRDKQDPKFLETLAGNEMGRDRLWKQAQRSRYVLDALDIKDTVGPWTSVADCTTYTIKVLEAYARKDKTGWRVMA